MEISPELQKLIDNEEWDEISGSQHLSEAFIEKFKDKVDWTSLQNNPRLNFLIIKNTTDSIQEMENAEPIETIVTVKLNIPVFFHEFYKTGSRIKVIDRGSYWIYDPSGLYNSNSIIYIIPSHVCEPEGNFHEITF